MMKFCIKSLFTAFCLLFSTVAMAEAVVIDGIVYDVITKAKVATVMPCTVKYSGDFVIPETIVYDGVVCDVTSIGDGAFNACTGLTSITIPNTVTTIGDYAFTYCSALTAVEIPNSVTYLGSKAFGECSKLKSVTLSENIMYIGEEMFSNSGIKSIVIPDKVVDIYKYAFAYCDNLESVTIGNGVKTIGDAVFYSCDNLAEVVMGNSVENIGAYVFNGCMRLSSINLPNSLKVIGGSAFRQCVNMTAVEFGNGVKEIGNSAFQDCSNLKSIKIPDSTTRIEDYAFYNCVFLSDVVIGNGVESIGIYAFENCISLVSVKMGEGIKRIYANAFSKCSDLTDVYCSATSVPDANAYAFAGSYPEYMTLHVPAESVSLYRTKEPWSNFGTIVALDGETPEVKVCATPVLSYSNGELLFECETEGAECVTDIKCNDNNRYYGNSINLSATYSISVYATLSGYENSETVNATLCWIESGDAESGNNIINVPATAALITSAGGAVTISCSLNGEAVAVYTTDGVLVGTATIDNGTATIATGLSKGTIVIVKIGEKSVKVVVG